jgi:L-ribulose-5-phosphate 4-epimerase
MRTILSTIVLVSVCLMVSTSVFAQLPNEDRPSRDHLIATAKRVYSGGLIFGTGGDISIRVPGADYFYIKATGTCMGDMTYADQAKVYIDGRVEPGSPQPSHETNIHVALYQKYPELGAIMHVHAPYTAAWATVGQLIPVVTQQSVNILKNQKITSYAAPGSKKLLDTIVDAYVPGTTVVLMENHGFFVTGKDLNDMLYKGEVVENAARVAYLTKALGTPVTFVPTPNEYYAP